MDSADLELGCGHVLPHTVSTRQSDAAKSVGRCVCHTAHKCHVTQRTAQTVTNTA
jgi:hypothetical protein